MILQVRIIFGSIILFYGFGVWLCTIMSSKQKNKCQTKDKKMENISKTSKE